MIDIKQIEAFYPEHLRAFKKNILREYLQYKILEIIFSSEFGHKLVFMGGTAIRIIHGSSRFSEDLDFDNTGLDKNTFSKLASIVERKMKLEGYNLEIRTVFKGAYRSYIKISDILFDNKISGYKEEKITVQIDAEPQNFTYVPDKVIINKFDVFQGINAVPADILLSQKIFAIFSRKRAMGRDFYDTIFLFGKTLPNYKYLNEKAGIKNKDELKKKLIV